MKTWKRMLAALLLLCVLGTAAGTMALATEPGDEEALGQKAAEYVTRHMKSKDLLQENDLLAGTLVEYAETLDEDPAEVWFDLDGEERSLEDLCLELEYYADRTEFQKLYNQINKVKPLEDYELSVDVQDIVIDGDYCRVELGANLNYRYPGMDFDTGGTDNCTVVLLRLDGTWYIALPRITSYEFYNRNRETDPIHDEVQYMKEHFDELVRKSELAQAAYGAMLFHDSIIGATAVKAAQAVKRTIYRELGVEMTRKYG